MDWKKPLLRYTLRTIVKTLVIFFALMIVVQLFFTFIGFGEFRVTAIVPYDELERHFLEGGIYFHSFPEYSVLDFSIAHSDESSWFLVAYGTMVWDWGQGDGPVESSYIRLLERIPFTNRYIIRRRFTISSWSTIPLIGPAPGEARTGWRRVNFFFFLNAQILFDTEANEITRISYSPAFFPTFFFSMHILTSVFSKYKTLRDQAEEAQNI
jgi:hypothetical protein